MLWWNTFVDWLSSDSGQRVVTDAAVPFVAIVVAGVVAALIGRAATRRVLAAHDDDARAAAIAGLVSAARKGAAYSSLGVEERTYVDHLGHEADVRLRLLPATGSTLAADWAAHVLADIKRNSASFSFEADRSLDELLDRLVEWQRRPGRAKKLFRDDLARWKHDEAAVDREAAERQKAWEAEHRAGVDADLRHRDETTGSPDAAASPVRLRPSVLADAPPRGVEARRAPVVNPLAGPPPVSAPEASAVTPGTSDDDARDDPMDDERFEQPVSASQVRRRIAPDRGDDD